MQGFGSQNSANKKQLKRGELHGRVARQSVRAQLQPSPCGTFRPAATYAHKAAIDSFNGEISRIKNTGRRYRQLYGGRLIAENGKIKLLREFCDTVEVARAMFPNGVKDLVQKD